MNSVTPVEVILSWLGLPIYVWQGLGVRRRTMRMAPPPSNAHYTYSGKGQVMKILIIGDSSVAGVGVEDFTQCLAGRLPLLLSEKLKRPVHARIAGNNSATAGQIRDYVVPHIEPECFDYIVLNIGTNDAKNFHTASRFKREFGTLIYALRTRFPDAVVLWSGLVDMAEVPALPSPLNKILGIRSRIIRNKGMTLCRERGAIVPDLDWPPIPENFSSDGFHASSRGYELWAELLAGYISERES